MRTFRPLFKANLVDNGASQVNATSRFIAYSVSQVAKVCRRGALGGYQVLRASVRRAAPLSAVRADFAAGQAASIAAVHRGPAALRGSVNETAAAAARQLHRLQGFGSRARIGQADTNWHVGGRRRAFGRAAAPDLTTASTSRPRPCAGVVRPVRVSRQRPVPCPIVAACGGKHMADIGRPP